MASTKYSAHIPLPGSPIGEGSARWKKALDLARSLPTIVDYEDELALMRLLISVDASDVAEDPGGFAEVAEKVLESHQGNGIFELRSSDEPLLKEYGDWLERMERQTGVPAAPYTDGLRATAAEIRSAFQSILRS